MGFLDALRDAAGGMLDQGAHQAFGSMLENTSLGGMSGLLSHLQDGGLGSQVEAWCQGELSGVTPDQIRSALGEAHIQALAAKLGLSTDELADHLAEHLPAMAQAHAEGG